MGKDTSDDLMMYVEDLLKEALKKTEKEEERIEKDIDNVVGSEKELKVRLENMIKKYNIENPEQMLKEILDDEALKAELLKIQLRSMFNDKRRKKGYLQEPFNSTALIKKLTGKSDDDKINKEKNILESKIEINEAQNRINNLQKKIDEAEVIKEEEISEEGQKLISEIQGDLGVAITDIKKPKPGWKDIFDEPKVKSIINKNIDQNYEDVVKEYDKLYGKELKSKSNSKQIIDFLMPKIKKKIWMKEKNK